MLNTTIRKKPAGFLWLLAISPLCFGQGNVLTVETPQLFTAKEGAAVEAKIVVRMAPGYHVQSNTPNDPYYIPLRPTWKPGSLEAAEVVYPKPKMEKYAFAETPLSVFSGNFELIAKFKVPANAQTGAANVTGTLRYQACNDSMCLAPRNLDVALKVAIVK